MGRKKGGETRRLQIVRGLMKVMASHGYERASIAAVARAAELAPGLVHYYFKSKQDILLALMGQLAAHLDQRYERRLRGEVSPWSRLDACIESHVGLSLPEAEAETSEAGLEDGDPTAVACWVAIGAEALHLEAVREVYESILRGCLEQLKLHLVEVLATEGLQTTQVHHMAAGLLSAIEGAYKLGMTSEGLVPKGFAAPMIKQMARGLIQAQPMRSPAQGSD